MQSILTHASSSSGERISQELTDSIEALQRYESLRFPCVIRCSEQSTVRSQVILVIWSRCLEQSLFMRA
jgi:hypothetical protein